MGSHKRYVKPILPVLRIKYYREEAVIIRKTNKTNNSTRKIRPALTPDAREKQLISLATDLVEQRLIDGTASSQETTHFLKLATTKSILDNEILENQKELIKAKTQSLQSAQRIEELYKDALNAMKNYSSQGGDDGV